MDLSIREAAALLGRSPRTIRHFAQTGRIPARRVGSRWIIDGDGLDELGEARRAEVERVRERINRTLDRALPPPPRDAGATSPAVGRASQARRGFYSARDLDAHRTAAEVLVALASTAEQHPHAREPLAEPTTALKSFLRLVTDGCHQFHPQTKIERFVRARSLLSSAVADLVCFNLLHTQPDLAALADRLERDALGALRGLLRRAERPSS